MAQKQITCLVPKKLQGLCENKTCVCHVTPPFTPSSTSTEQEGNTRVWSTFPWETPVTLAVWRSCARAKEMPSRLNQKENRKKSERPIKCSELPWYLENWSEINKKEIQLRPHAEYQTLKEKSNLQVLNSEQVEEQQYCKKHWPTVNHKPSTYSWCDALGKKNEGWF